MTKKKPIEVNKIINLNKQDTKTLLQILENLRSINAHTDDKCPIDYDQVCQLDAMEHQIANMVGAEVKCEHAHYSRWSGSYEYKT
jgi:hypothetical protein